MLFCSAPHAVDEINAQSSFIALYRQSQTFRVQVSYAVNYFDKGAGGGEGVAALTNVA